MNIELKKYPKIHNQILSALLNSSIFTKKTNNLIIFIIK